MAEGVAQLKTKLLHFRPKIVCFNGMGIYAAFSGKKTVTLGLQEEKLRDMLLFVVPSSSGRTAAYQRDVKLRCYRELKALVETVSAGPVEASP